MFSNQILTARLTAGLLALALAITGCASSGSANRPDSAAAETPQAAAAPEADVTATDAAISHADTAASASATPEISSNVVNPTAPKRYTVKRGDTLWDIASMFLKDPWLWPEIWYVNPQVKNPHLIYPGDVLALAYGSDGRPQIRLESGGAARLSAARLEPRLRSSPLDGAIPAIPYASIAAFLSRPAVLTAAQVKHAPHIVAIRDDHVVAGAGNDVYVSNLDAPQNARFSVMHIGDALRDPDDGKVLGYEGIYTATALVVQPGNPAKAELMDSARETVDGDRLFANDTANPLTFVPRAPDRDVRGRIISVVDGVEVIGQFQIVTINRGTSQGVEPGTVLAVDTAGEVVPDRGNSHFGFAPSVKLPNERAGTLLVFKAFNRLSYALVVGAAAPMHVLDVVHNP